MAKTKEPLTKVIVDCTTGISEVVELTAEEIADLEAARIQAEADRAAAEAEATAKAAARQVILDRLGLTADEAALLLG